MTADPLVGGWLASAGRIPSPNFDARPGGEPPSLAERLWTDGLAILTSADVPERQARSLVGRWRKLAGDAHVLAKLSEAQALSIADPVPWMERAVRSAGGPPRRETEEERFARERREWVERNYGPDSPRARRQRESQGAEQ